jgi:transcription elongation factor GreA
MERVYTTTFQRARLEKKIEELQKESYKISDEAGKAGALGDHTDSGEFESSTRHETLLYLQLKELHKQLDYEILDVSQSHSLERVMFCSQVRVINQTEMKEVILKIIGEGIIYSDLGEISYLSPIGKGLLGAMVGDIKEIRVPNGTIQYKILSIKLYTPKE